MSTSYWIAHPSAAAFISAFSPQGVVRSLEAARDWPAGSYVIRTHRHGETAAGDGDLRWGRAVKDGDGGVRIEPFEGGVRGADDDAP